MNPREWLITAAELAEGTSQRSWRTSVGRSYYAFFHVGGLWLARCGFRVPDSDRAHAFVWLRLQNCGEPDIAELGVELDALRSFRNLVDYNVAASFSQMTARRALESATLSIDTIDELLADDTIRATVTEGIRKYEREVLRDVTWRGDAATNGEA